MFANVHLRYYVYTHIHTYTRIHIYSLMYVCMCVFIYMYICICARFQKTRTPVAAHLRRHVETGASLCGGIAAHKVGGSWPHGSYIRTVAGPII